MKKVLFLVVSMVSGFTCAMDRDLPENASIEQALQYGLKPTPFELNSVQVELQDSLRNKYKNAAKEARQEREDTKRAGRIAKSRVTQVALYSGVAWKNRFVFGW